MRKYVIVTAKINADLKERLKKLEVNVSGLIREALELEANRMERERIRKLAEEAGVILQKIPTEELVEAIRMSREHID